MLLDGPMNGPAFLAYAEQVLAPELRPGGHLKEPPHPSSFMIYSCGDLREAANARTGRFLGH